MEQLIDTFFALFAAPAFTVFGASTTWGEVLGFGSGALCVWLVVKVSVWNWPVGIANSLFFFVLFVQAGLFAAAVLQVVFAALGVFGLWSWLHGGQRRTQLPVTRVNARDWIGLGLIGVAGFGIITWFLAAHTSSTVPEADAATTVLSLLATWLQARKKVECWWLWIAADVIYIPLYLYKGLTLTAILYVGFLALCIFGLRAWRREAAQATQVEANALPTEPVEKEALA